MFCSTCDTLVAAIVASAATGSSRDQAIRLTKFGRGQVILRDPASSVLRGSTEPRTDAAVLAW